MLSADHRMDEQEDNFFGLYEGRDIFIRSDVAHLISRSEDTTATNTSTAAARISLSPEEAAHFKRLVEGFEFSRWFYLSYQAVIVAVVGVAALWRWTERARRRTRRNRRRVRGDKYAYEAIERTAVAIQYAQEDAEQERKEGASDQFYIGPHSRNDLSEEASGPSSSPSSTRNSSRTRLSKVTIDRVISSGQKSPKQELRNDVSNATSPLLSPVDRPHSRPCRPRTVLIPWHWTWSFLAYQPKPLPIIRRIIPDNLTTLVILGFFAINLFYLLFKIPFGTITWVDTLSDRAGLMWAANLPWLYLLAAKNQPLKRLIGDSYENLNLLHRRQGEYMCWVLAPLHFGLMVAAWAIHLQQSGSLWWFLFEIHYITWGVYAFSVYALLALGSLSSVRTWCYELFLASHVFLQAAGLALLWLHHFRTQGYVLAALLIFLLDRTVWRLSLKKMNVKVDLEVLEDGQTVRVSGNWPVKKPLSWRQFFGTGMQKGWEPSQHVFITVPGISRKHAVQAHPMTIASAAPILDESGSGHAWFNLIIRAKDGFSKELLEHARVFDSATVRLDGPYGSLHALEMLEASDVAVIVAGGSGIAVAYPLLWHLLHNQPREHLDDRSQRVCLLWVVQDASHISWIGDERLAELRELGCRVIVPPPSRKHGRPDACGLLTDCVNELVAEWDESVGVVVSGPDGLNRDIRNACAKMISKGRNCEVAVEKFGW